MYTDNFIAFGLDINVLTYITDNTSVAVSSLIPSAAIAAAFFIALIIFVVFIQFIIGILNICCCNKKANPNDK